MAEIRKLNKMGNSYTVYMPKRFLEQFGLRSGSFIIITLERDGILIRPLALVLEEKENL